MEQIPEGLCQCGCGQKTTIARTTSRNRGWIGGKPIKYIDGHAVAHYARNHPGELSPAWKSGETRLRGGYTQVRVAPNIVARKHRFLAEKAMGKSIAPIHPVHHHFGPTNDDMLVVCEDQSYHLLLHMRKRAINACGNPNWMRCPYCKKYDDPENMYIRPSGRQGWHRECAKLYKNSKKRPPKISSRSRVLEHDGKSLIMESWCSIAKCGHSSFRYRLARGWTVGQIIKHYSGECSDRDECPEFEGVEG